MNDRPREEIEARLTALLLGEAGAEEEAELRRRLGEDAELAGLFRRLEATIGLVREATRPPALATAAVNAPAPKMSEDRRQRLLKVLRKPAGPQFQRRRVHWSVPLSLAACLIALLSFTLLQSTVVSRRTAQRSFGNAMLFWDGDGDRTLPASEAEAPQAPGGPSHLNFQVPEALADTALNRRGDAMDRDVLSRVTPYMMDPKGTAELFEQERLKRKLPEVSAPLPALRPSAGVEFGGFAGGAGVGGGGAAKVREEAKASAAEDRRRLLTRGVQVQTGVADQSKLNFDVIQDTPPPPAQRQPMTPPPAAEPASGASELGVGAALGSNNRLRRESLEGAPVLGDAPSAGHFFRHRDPPRGGTEGEERTAPSGSAARQLGEVRMRYAGRAGGAEKPESDRRNEVRPKVEAADREEAQVRLFGLNEPQKEGLEQLGKQVQLGTSLLALNGTVTARTSEALSASGADSGPASLDAYSISASDKAWYKETVGNEPQQVTKLMGEIVRLAALDDSLATGQGLAEEAKKVADPETWISTFSLNVSDVSFELAAAALEGGQHPERSSVRVEEFVNAFDYRDPEPAPGLPVALVWERAQYPFAHDREIMRLSLKTASIGREAARPLNLVLLLDNSGSMERPDRVVIVRTALRVLAGMLQPSDKVSVVAFARTPRLWVDGMQGGDPDALLDRVLDLQPEGGTNLEAALHAAYEAAARHFLQDGQNRVVLLTDGAANLGNVDPATLKALAERQRKAGIALDCFGIGWQGFNDILLETLSRNADGRYGFLNNPAEAESEFAVKLAGALQVAASDVKVQVEFNPRRVTDYRQLGYTQHQLTAEQFRDNTVDAAELAAAEAGTALYLVQTRAAGEGPVCTVRVRFKSPGTETVEEREWVVPYDGAVPALENAPPPIRLATVAAAFAEWLEGSPHAAEAHPQALLRLLQGVPREWPHDPRPRRLEWMLRQAAGMSGE